MADFSFSSEDAENVQKADWEIEAEKAVEQMKREDDEKKAAIEREEEEKR